MSLFANTYESGSLVGLFLLVYASNVAMEVLRVQQLDPAGVYSARVLYSGLATLFSLACLPCIIWPVAYVAGYDGWLAAPVVWLVLQLRGARLVGSYAIRGRLLQLHLLLGVVALPVGYYLTVTTSPWASH